MLGSGGLYIMTLLAYAVTLGTLLVLSSEVVDNAPHVVKVQDG
jgi:hypothetical protein